MRASATAGESTYAGIVRLVTAAQTAKAPFIRLADRYALLLLPITLVVAGAAWLLSGDPIRGLAVLVAATPCPLILAAPVALIAGVSQAARQGHSHKGRRTVGGARPHPYRHLRQDRHAHRRRRAPDCHRGGSRREPGRGAAVGRIAGAGLAPRGGGGNRRGCPRQGSRAGAAGAHPRDHGLRTRRADRGPQGLRRIPSAGAWRPQARGLGRARATTCLLALRAQRVRVRRWPHDRRSAARRRAEARDAARSADAAQGRRVAHRDGHRRSRRCGRDHRCRSRSRCRARRSRALRQGRRRRDRATPRPDADGWRRNQRCTGAGRGRRRHRHGRQGGQRVVGGCRRRHSGGSPRSGLGRGSHRQAGTRHCPAEHRHGAGHVRR